MPAAYRMATPFDESSVEFCCELGIPILKIASSDCNDWILIEKIAKTKKAGDRLHGWHFTQGYRRPGYVFRQPPYSAGD